MTTRRRFLKSVTRWLLAGGLFAGVWHLAARKGEPKHFACAMKLRVCKGCPALARCSHPDAVTLKETDT